MIKKAILLMCFAGAGVNAQTITQTFGSGANAFSIDFVQIGNPGNAPDTTGNPNPAGSVEYIYNMGKYEISRGQIEKANLAAVLGITMQDMTNVYGAASNGANRPATGIGWNEAARFVNYLNTSQGHQAAYNFTTIGARDNITLWGAGQYSGSNQYRHKNAYYFLPSVDEWYKGAYGSPNGTWYDFATGSDSPPTSVSGGTSPNTAVYNQSVSADVTDAGGLSPYGTMAQGGNAFEWMENALDLSNDSETEVRELRGGFWGSDVAFPLGAWARAGQSEGYPDIGNNFSSIFGFRVASVPEPSALSLLAIGLGGLAMMRRRLS